MNIADEIREHLQINASTESYRHLPGVFEQREGRYGYFIEWDKLRESHIEPAKKNLEILKRRVEEFNKREGPRVGDYLELPYDMNTRFTHEWNDGIQIGGGSHSFYLGDGGYISYSGGLDPSIEYKYLVPTDRMKDGMVWFFHEGWSGGGRGVYFRIPFRVFTLSPDYDENKIWMVQDKKRELYRNQAETITRVNGNGQEYTLPIPELFLMNVKPEQVKFIEEKSGLKFEAWSSGFRCQPLRHSELNCVKLVYDWEETFYNNGSIKNSLYLKFIADRRK